jgi:hypothetical protein
MFNNFFEKKFWLIKNLRSLKNWHKRNFRSPSPSFIKLKILNSENMNNCLWIETGTYYGETTYFLSKIAKKVISVEADERLFNLASSKFKLFRNVEIFLSKSEEILEKILIKEKDFKNLCIYLDAHLCIDHIKKIDTFGSKNTSTPIVKELEIIEKNLKNFKSIKIFIDDIRLFNLNYHNYPNINEIVDWCKKNQLQWTIEQDILIAKTNSN